MRTSIAVLLALLWSAPVSAADKTTVGELITEPPTLVSLGFEWRIDGDDNRNAQVTVSYRKAGEQTWKPGPPLLRIGHERINENALQYMTPNGFAGSLFDLEPATNFTGRTWTNLPEFNPKLISEYAVKVYGSGHVVAYNSIANFHDGVDVATYGNPDGSPRPVRDRLPVSIDFYGIDISNVEDNCIEADGTGQDAHSVLVDFDVFVKVAPPGPDPRTLYKPADLDFRLREGSVAVDAGVRLTGINDDFTGKAPDLGAHEVGRPVPHYGPR